MTDVAKHIRYSNIAFFFLTFRWIKAYYLLRSDPNEIACIYVTEYLFRQTIQTNDKNLCILVYIATALALFRLWFIFVFLPIILVYLIISF